MLRIYFTLIFIFTLFSIEAQSIDKELRCAADAYMEKVLSDPEELLKFKNYKKEVSKSVDFNKSFNCTNPIIIPVAVHYSGGITTANSSCLITKAQEQIDVLNQDFGAYNTDIVNYCNLSASCCTTYPASSLSQGACIQFCLATMNHPSTTGLVNTSYAITVGTYTFDGNATPWSGYLNIFVSDVSPAGASGALGLAPVAGGSDPDGNGVYVVASSFGGSGTGCTSGVGIDDSSVYNLGRTGTHEVGHYFGLEHVFNGSCANGDGIADTPAQSVENYGCPTTNTTSCTSTADNSCSTEDFYFNYMDYVDDACMYMFTEDQGQVMYSTALLAGSSTNNAAYKSNTSVCNTTPVYNPTYPSGCPGTGGVTSVFSHMPAGSAISVCANSNTISFTNESIGCGITGYSWTFSGAGVSPTTSTDPEPIVSISSGGVLTASLTVSNSSGNNTSSENITITYLPASDPSCAVACTSSDGGPYLNLSNASSCFQSCPTISPNFQVYTNESYVVPGLEAGTSYTIEFCNGYSTSNWSAVITVTPSGSTNVLASTEGCSLSFSPATAGDYVIYITDKNNCGGTTQAIDNGFITFATTCSTCPEVDGTTFTDDYGANYNYVNNQSESYTICPDAPNELLSISFTAFNVQGNTNCPDVLEVFYGSNTTGTADHSLCGNSIASLPQGGVFEGQGYGECISFLFSSNGNQNRSGWVADIESCTTTLNNNVSDGDIPFAAVNGGNPFGWITVDNTCSVNATLTDITSLQSGSGSLSKVVCSANNVGYENQVFYAIECNDDPNTTLLEVEVEDLTTAGNIDVALYGPVTGSYPNYTGGSSLACDDTPDASGLYQVSINSAGVSMIYILVIATENEGTFRFRSTSNANALPVELLEFTAQKESHNSARLDWTTANEVNNLGFYVERSSDQKTFDRLGFIKSKGEGENRYEFIDNNIVVAGDYYYRLAQEDFDGIFNLSNTQLVIFEEQNEITISPIPSVNMIYIDLGTYSHSVTSLQIFDAIGNQLFELENNQKQQQLSLSVASLASGVYYLVTTIDSEVIVDKFIVTK